jgi:hypothetical protein
MLEVRIDLVPFGQESSRQTIDSIFIANIGPTVGPRGKELSGTWRMYQVTLLDPRFPANKDQIKYKFKHMREDGALVCTLRALEAIDNVDLYAIQRIG